MTLRHRYLVGFLVILCFGLAGGILLKKTSIPSFIREKTWHMWGSIVAALPWNTPNSPSLEEKVQILERENTALKSERHLFAFLQSQLKLSDPFAATSISGRVIGRPLDTFHSQLIINKGSRDGVVMGAPVIIDGATLIGVITDVHDTVSTCRLLLHPDTALSAGIVLDEGPPISGLIQGKQYTSVMLTTVPKDKPLSPEQTVVSLTQNELIPPGLLIGTIQRIETTDDAVYQQATLLLPYDPDTLSVVQILKV